jgi:hypothetical protein
MFEVELDPVFAMAESISLDGGSRLDDRNRASLTLASVSEQRLAALPKLPIPDVGRCRAKWRVLFRTYRPGRLDDY